MMAAKISGHCLCGAIAFEGMRDREEIDACHCTQCRRWSGHYWASVNVPFSSLKFERGESDVGWYASSDLVRRGFCTKCGSALFWHPDRHKEYSHIIAISAGSLDAPSGLMLSKHIFVSEKGDYYGIKDDLPQNSKY